MEYDNITHALLHVQKSLLDQIVDDPKTCERIKKHSEQINRVLSSANINYCLNLYIDAELDYETAGNRGLGRVTEAVPRLGAFFRRHISKLSTADLESLRIGMRVQCLLGYMTHVIFLEDEIIADASSLYADELYKEWVPTIYSNIFSELPESAGPVFAMCSEPGTDVLNKFFHDHGMKAGWFQSKNLINGILGYYFIAGLCLRKAEIKLAIEEFSFTSVEVASLTRCEKEKNPDKIIIEKTKTGCSLITPQQLGGAQGLEDAVVHMWDKYHGQENTETVLIQKAKELAWAINMVACKLPSIFESKLSLHMNSPAFTDDDLFEINHQLLLVILHWVEKISALQLGDLSPVFFESLFRQTTLQYCEGLYKKEDVEDIIARITEDYRSEICVWCRGREFMLSDDVLFGGTESTHVIQAQIKDLIASGDLLMRYTGVICGVDCLSHVLSSEDGCMSVITVLLVGMYGLNVQGLLRC